MKRTVHGSVSTWRLESVPLQTVESFFLNLFCRTPLLPSTFHFSLFPVFQEFIVMYYFIHILLFAIIYAFSVDGTFLLITW